MSAVEIRLPKLAIVDDDTIFQFTTHRTLSVSKMTGEILQFVNGNTALEYLTLHSGEKDSLPDYIFLDINMPVIDGWMFLDEYLKIKDLMAKEIQIYMLSSSVDKRDINKAMSFGIVKEYISKPITSGVLARLLNFGPTATL